MASRKSLVGLYPGDSPNGHFADAATRANDDKNGVHNGMNEEPDIPRFGADSYDD